MAPLFEAGRVRSIQFFDIFAVHEQRRPEGGWDTHFLTTAPEAIDDSQQLIQTENLQLAEETFSPGLIVQAAPPPGTIAIGVVASREAMPRSFGREVKPDQILTTAATGHFELACSRTFRWLWLAIGEKYFARQVERLLKIDGTRFVKHNLVAPGEAHRDYLQPIWRRLIQLGLDSPEKLREPALAHLIEQEMLDALLIVCQPVANQPEVDRAQRHKAVTKAVAYIQEHRRTPVTLQDLCMATGVSQRALQFGFKERFDLTPKEYIDLTRLHFAYYDLRRADPAQASVTEIATHWGFFHLGRFAEKYRLLFGESPRATLNGRSRRERVIGIGQAPTLRLRAGSEGPGKELGSARIPRLPDSILPAA
jgi:AraC family ethanolamine operon transcriptional activator